MEENWVWEDLRAMADNYEAMKKFIVHMKRELTVLGLLPHETSGKQIKFNLTKLQFDSRTLRQLYERWNDETITQVISSSRPEALGRQFSSILEKRRMSRMSTKLISPRIGQGRRPQDLDSSVLNNKSTK
jgi:hypothetical protein